MSGLWQNTLMDAYQTLIEQEEAKLTLLRQKIAACEQRIAALRTLAQTDDVDDAITTAIGKVPAPPPAVVSELAEGREAPVARADGRRVRKDSVVIEVLTFLRTGVKSLDEIEKRLTKIGKTRSRGYLRTALMGWRAKNHWIDNPRPGRYGLSKVGEAFLAAHKGESPGA